MKPQFVQNILRLKQHPVKFAANTTLEALHAFNKYRARYIKGCHEFKQSKQSQQISYSVHHLQGKTLYKSPESVGQIQELIPFCN